MNLNTDSIKKMISFVIPCYESEQTIVAVIEEIQSVMDKLGDYNYEIITVNDCSPDNVWETLCLEAKNKACLTAVDLSKNVGKQGAVMAGFQFVTGDIVVCLDDDGQCPTEHLKDLLVKIDEGYDVSMAKYGRKAASRYRNLGSAFNDLVFRIILDKPKDMQLTNFYAMKRFVMDKMIEYKNSYPYLHGLMLRTTSKIASVPMKERDRFLGTSGYTIHKLISFWADGLTGFSVKPLRMSTIIGLLSSLAGVIGAIILTIERILYGIDVKGWTSLMVMQLVFNGIILMCVGLIGEYVGRVYLSVNSMPQYVIREVRGEHCKDV